MARLIRSIVFLMMLSLTAISPGTYASDGVENAHDLEHDGCRAKRLRAPLVLVFTRSDCAFCKALKKQVVAPLALMYRQRQETALFREVITDLSPTISDFDGRQKQAATIAEFYKVDFYPTIVIVDENGEELTKRIVGFTGSEYAGFYLEKSVESARLRLSVAER